MIRGLYERLDDVIYDSGLSKAEIARRGGIDRKILMPRHDNCDMCIRNLAKVCAVLNVSADYLLGLSKEKYIARRKDDISQELNKAKRFIEFEKERAGNEK